MTDLDFDRLRRIVAEHHYPLLFATISGAHLYGFPSEDSDVDIRGAHILPVREVVGLRPGPDTLDRMWIEDEVEFDLVTHDLGKFCRLLQGRNGNALEMLLSPLVVASSEIHTELVSLAPGCLTRHHTHHYRGFAITEWNLFAKSGELKPLLYTFRALLTGIHAMRTGLINANLPSLAVELTEAQQPDAQRRRRDTAERAGRGPGRDHIAGTGLCGGRTPRPRGTRPPGRIAP